VGKCPNCGRATARTKDWACQWCGYPLLSGFYKKIPETFSQLKGESPHKPKSSAGEETEASVRPNHASLMQTQMAEPEPEPTPAPVQVPETKQMAEPGPEPTPAPVQVPETKQMAEPEPEPTPAAKETTVEQLILAYEVDEAAADAEFTNNILQLTGVVTKIEASGTLDVHYIVLSCAENKGPQSVRCLFPKTFGAELNQLTKEQTVTVQGKYNGSIIAMRMRDCVLVC